MARLERAALILIICLGTWLRFQHLGDIELNIDQAYPIWQAVNTLDTGALPLTGQGTSVLFANPTLTGYFFAPFMALTHLPLAAFLLTLTLNSLAIWLAFRGLYWLLGTRPALIGAALFAVNPWIIEDSRRTWVQSLMPFFACLIFWALVRIFTRQTRHPQKRLLIALISLALFANTYLLAYALAIPVGLLLLIFWKTLPKKALVVGGTFFVVLLAFYGMGLVNQRDETVEKSEDFVSEGFRFSDEALNHAMRLITGVDYAAARGGHAPADDAKWRDDASHLIHGGWGVLLLIGIGLAVYHLRLGAEKQRQAALILLIWFFAPIVLMSYVSQKVHPFYLLLTVPAGHGLVAWGSMYVIDILRGKKEKNTNHRDRRNFVSQNTEKNLKNSVSSVSLWFKNYFLTSAIVGLILFTSVINGVNVVRFAQETNAHPGEHLPETPPLAEGIAIGQKIEALRQPGMVIYTPMEAWTIGAITGRIFPVEKAGEVERALLLPPDGALYVLPHLPDEPIAAPLIGDLADALHFSDGTVINFWRVQPDVTIENPVNYPSDIEVSFVGWTLEGGLTAGAESILTTYWRIDQLFPERGIWTFIPYAHLLDSVDTVLIIKEGAYLAPLTWNLNDLMIQRFIIEMPANASAPFAINIGLYDSVRGINAIFRLPNSDGTNTFSADIKINQ